MRRDHSRSCRGWAAGQRLQLRHRLVEPAERELRVGAQRQRAQAQFRQPRGLRARERRRHHVRQRVAAPQLDRRVEPLERDVGPVRRQRAAALVEQRLEAVRVKLAGLDPERVAVRAARQAAALAGRPQQAAQLGHADLQARARAVPRVLRPQLLDQPVGGDDAIGVDEQHRQHAARASADCGQ
ncbi:MAG TPA: hypothetical protein VFZ00_25120, partial [Solirubrobacter sp.]|nr:hypothetical protein [Solirubrobacter sp.]